MALAVVAATSSTLAQPASPKHLSPDGLYAVILTSDTAFGQVERIQVLIHPGKAEAKVLFESVGEVPLRFLGWTDVATGEFEELSPDEAGHRRLLLHCDTVACELERVFQPSPGASSLPSARP